MNEAIRKLREEHRSISAVLQGLQALVREARKPGARPDFAVLRAMIYYIDAFPERLHHPKEDQHLFARLEMRAPEAAALLARLRAEHLRGATLVRELEHELLALEENWPAGVERFAAAVDAYAEFHWEHMRSEEHELLPLAERALTAQDWEAIGAAFAGNADPLAGLREQDFAQLYSRIANLAPAPVGLGEPWRKAR